MIVVARRALVTATSTLGVPFLPTPLVGENSFSVTTSAPFNPPANSLLLAIALNRSTALMGAATLSDNAGGALTWSLRNDKLYDLGTGIRARLRVFCALVGAAPPIGSDRHQHQHARALDPRLCLPHWPDHDPDQFRRR